MNREEDDGLPKIFFSQETKDRFSQVIGFDLGYSALSCSFSTDEIPKSAAVFEDWVDGSENESLFPACIQYKSWSTASCKDIKVGFEGRPEVTPLDEGVFYIPSIKNYVIKWINQGAQDSQPDASLVLKDFFEAVRTHLENAFKKSSKKYKKKQAAERYNLDNCRFCFTLPDDSPFVSQYAKLVRKAFKQAGFLKEDDDDNRLVFLHDAVAVGYGCTTAAQIVDDLKLETNYLIADIGYEAAKFFVVQCQGTVTAKPVSQLDNVNELGYRSFSHNFKNYIRSRSMVDELDINQPEELDALVTAFERHQENKIDLSDDYGETHFVGLNKTIAIDNSDLREYVFMPYLDYIFNFIAEQCQAYRVARIIFRAPYCRGPYFYMTCENYMCYNRKKFRNIPECISWNESMHMASYGAVLFGHQIQTPTIVPSETPVAADNSNDTESTGGSDRSSEWPSHLLNLPKGHFAVGIDFGTTFSGCSYADISFLKPGENTVIQTIGYWDIAYSYPKVCTALRYNENSGKFSKYWGFDAINPHFRRKNGDRTIEFFKLLLQPENVYEIYGDGNKEIQDNLSNFFIFDWESKTTDRKKKTKALTPTDIIAEYLKNLDTKIKNYLQGKTGVKVKTLKLHYVITVPAMWTSYGRAIMIDAAAKAGLNHGIEKSVQLITEPEAAALSCQKLMKETMLEHYYNPRFIFTVCDIGGGTVELVNFKQSLEFYTHGKEEKAIEHIGERTGGICGAIDIDKRFRMAIVNFYRQDMRLNVKRSFIDHHVDFFKDNIKDHFMPSDHPDAVYRIPLPPSPEIPPDTKPQPWEESNDPNVTKPVCRLAEGNTFFEISVTEIKRCVFDPVVDEVVNLLKSHLDKTRGKHGSSAVLLVGGFSHSNYLRKKIYSLCHREYIHCELVPDGINAISRGAVSYFLTPQLLPKKISPSSYLKNLQKTHGNLTDIVDLNRQSTYKSVSAQFSTIYSHQFNSAFSDQLSYITGNTDRSNVPCKPSDYEESEHLKRSVDHSMYQYFIGIDIGSNSISCSYTNLYDQAEVHSITEWNTAPVVEGECSADWLLEQEAYFERYPTCILYKDGGLPGKEVLCGRDALIAPKTAKDLFIPNIKILLNNTFAQTQPFKMNDHGLTVFKVVKDFLKGFLKHLLPLLLDNIRQDLQSQLAQDIKFTSATEDYILKKDIDERRKHVQRVLSELNTLLDNSQFNVVFSATGDAYNVVEDLISEAFAESGVFETKFDNRRLRFTHSADAAAYTCLSRPRYMSELKYQGHYLLCDIGYTSVTISKFETGGTALLNSIGNIDISPGAETINHHFKKYLNDNKTHYGITSEKQIEDLAVKFSEMNLVTIFDLSDEEESFVCVNTANSQCIQIPVNTLCHIVAKEFIYPIIRKLSLLYTEYPKIDKIFVSGRYHSTQLFWEQVLEVYKDPIFALNKDPTFANSIVSFSGDSGHDISSGAVQHGIHTEGHSSQFPENDDFQQQRTKFAEPPLEDFNIKDDFVLGIDLGNILSGCSYKAPSNPSIQVVKNWHHKPYDKDGKIPTALVIRVRKTGPFKIVCWGDEAKGRKTKSYEKLVEGMKLHLCVEDTTKFYNNDFFESRDNYTFNNLLKEYSMLKQDDVLHLLTLYLANLVELFKKSQKLKKGQKLCIVLTAPAMWSTITRHRLIEKAIQEKIIGKKDKLKIKIISELEAAAIAYEPYLSRLHNSDTPLTFIMADIGGKTADLSTFQLFRKYDMENNLIRTISSVEDDRGGVCGAIFLQERFKDLVKDIYHKNGIAAYGLQPFLDYYANHFTSQLKENHFKHRITNRNSCFEIPLPEFHYELCRDRKDYNHTIDPDRKKLRILYQDINDRVFEPLVERITDLLRHQIEESVTPVDAIVLVGGFLNSTYLQERIKQTLPESIEMIIENPDGELYNRSTCVSHGAASYFMNSQLLSHTYANQSYAISVGSKNANNAKALMCVVRKNDFVKGNIYQHLIHVTFPNNAVIEISASCETGVAADSIMKSGELVPVADVSLFVEVMTYVYAMPEFLSKVFEAGDKVALQVAFQITSQGDLDVKISLALDQETLERHSITSCLKSFRI